MLSQQKIVEANQSPIDPASSHHTNYKNSLIGKLRKTKLELLNLHNGDSMKFQLELPNFHNSISEMGRLKNAGLTLEDVGQTAKGYSDIE